MDTDVKIEKSSEVIQAIDNIMDHQNRVQYLMSELVDELLIWKNNWNIDIIGITNCGKNIYEIHVKKVKDCMTTRDDVEDQLREI